MEILEKNLNQVPDNLLSFLRDELGDTKVDYEVRPSRILGGNETFIFHFKLKNVHPSLSERLVLRIFRKGFRPKHAIMESVVHNSLVDQGLPVPYVHYSCIDQKYLGEQFMIMDFLPGKMLHLVFGQDTYIVLGKMHAALHKIDPNRLSKAMTTEGFGGRQYSIEGKLDLLLKAIERFHWLKNIVVWLIENRPPECENPSICHGDFHEGNLLAKDGKVTAILDWSQCRISDPVMDVAATLVLQKAVFKHTVPSYDSISNWASQIYLQSYRQEKELNDQYLEYFQLFRYANALMAAANGSWFWTQPPILNELIKNVYEISKIHVLIPE
jgi:aminoglycoside phosphotransferase (APT) family kinase protein